MDKYDYTYYTALINNHDSSYKNSDISEPHCVFNETRTTPIITDCSKYDMTITNFKLDTKTLPVFIPVIQFNNSPTVTQPDRHKTIYTVTLEFNGTSFTKNVRIKTQDRTISGTTAPAFKDGNADYSTGYYNVYNYEWFFRAVNKAIASCFTHLIAALDHFGDITYTQFEQSSGEYEFPNFVFDKSGGVIYLNAPKSTFNDDNTSDAYMNIYLNEPLYRLFNSLPSEKQAIQTRTYDYETNIEQLIVNQTIFKIFINNFKDANEISMYAKTTGATAIATVKTAHLVVYQDYETLTSWTPVESITITSSNMPIKSSIISNNHSFVNGRETTEGSTNIIEMELSEFRAGNFIPGLIYEPKNYRWVNMIDQQELTKMNIQVYWRNKYNGLLLPLKINSGGSFSLKLCFRKLME